MFSVLSMEKLWKRFLKRWDYIHHNPGRKWCICPASLPWKRNWRRIPAKSPRNGFEFWIRPDESDAFVLHVDEAAQDKTEQGEAAQNETERDEAAQEETVQLCAKTIAFFQGLEQWE